VAVLSGSLSRRYFFFHFNSHRAVAPLICLGFA
jgi:hypothetical protein